MTMPVFVVNQTDSKLDAIVKALQTLISVFADPTARIAAETAAELARAANVAAQAAAPVPAEVANNGGFLPIAGTTLTTAAALALTGTLIYNSRQALLQRQNAADLAEAARLARERNPAGHDFQQESPERHQDSSSDDNHKKTKEDSQQSETDFQEQTRLFEEETRQRNIVNARNAAMLREQERALAEQRERQIKQAMIDSYLSYLMLSPTERNQRRYNFGDNNNFDRRLADGQKYSDERDAEENLRHPDRPPITHPIWQAPPVIINPVIINPVIVPPPYQNKPEETDNAAIAAFAKSQNDGFSLGKSLVAMGNSLDPHKTPVPLAIQGTPTTLQGYSDQRCSITNDFYRIFMSNILAGWDFDTSLARSKASMQGAPAEWKEDSVAGKEYTTVKNLNKSDRARIENFKLFEPLDEANVFAVSFNDWRGNGAPIDAATKYANEKRATYIEKKKTDKAFADEAEAKRLDDIERNYQKELKISNLLKQKEIDDAKKAQDLIDRGYKVAKISTTDPKHPDYEKFYAANEAERQFNRENNSSGLVPPPEPQRVQPAKKFDQFGNEIKQDRVNLDPGRDAPGRDGDI